MIGVNFQPGSGSGVAGNRPNGNQAGVQEAIKVLSLRLPRVVGAQGVASAPLLQSAGSDGSRVDSVVNSILGRMFPTGAGDPPSNTPSFGTAPAQSESGPSALYGAPTYSGPTFSGSGASPQRQPSAVTYASPMRPPRVIAGGGPMGVGDGPSSNPPGLYEDLPGLFGGSPYGLDGGGAAPPASIAPLPSWPAYQPMPEPYEQPTF